MSGLTDRIAEVLWAHQWTDGVGGCRCRASFAGSSHPQHVAAAVAAELASWDFLMALLNEHYPDDVFPTMEDRTDRDPGPRIVSLIRHLDAARRSEVQP
jgi:hypothetical protein